MQLRPEADESRQDKSTRVDLKYRTWPVSTVAGLNEIFTESIDEPPRPGQIISSAHAQAPPVAALQNSHKYKV